MAGGEKMSFTAEYLLFVSPCILVLGGLFAFSALRRGWRKAALAGLGLSLPLGFAAAKAGYLCFYLQPQLARWGIMALVMPRADTFSFVCGCAGAALGLVLGAKSAALCPRELLNLFAPYGAGMVMCFRLGERWLGTRGAGALLSPEHWAAGTVLSLENSWGEWHWAACVWEAAFALACAVLTLTVWKRREDRFARTALLLCCGRIFFELMRANTPTWHFVRIDQLWSACILIGFGVAAFVRGRQWGPVLVSALLLGLNAYLQFALDKPELMTAFLPEGLAAWIGNNIKPVCHTGFMLTAVGLWFAACQSLKGIYLPSWNIRSMTS